MLEFSIGLLLGFFLGAMVMGIMSLRSYNKGYADALKKGDMFEQ